MSIISQSTAAGLADQIRTETNANANTATRVGTLFRNLVDSLSWVPFVASGLLHAPGLVPDPGAAPGNSRYLCEDGTWRAPGGAFTTPVNGTDDGKVAYASGGSLVYAAHVKTDGSYVAVGVTPSTSGSYRGANNVALLTAAATGGGADVIAVLVDALNVVVLGGAGTTPTALRVYANATSNVTSAINGHDTHIVSANGVSIATAAATTGAPPVVLNVTPGAHNGVNNAEPTDVVFGLGRTITVTAGDIASARAVRILAPTYAFTADTNVGEAVTLAIAGAPGAGAHAIITNLAALRISSGGLAFSSAPTSPTAITWSSLGFLKFAKNPGVLMGYLAHDGVTSKAALTAGGDGATFTDVRLGDADPVTGNNFVYLQSKTFAAVRIANNVEYQFSATALDMIGSALVDLNYARFTTPTAPAAPTGGTDVIVYSEGGYFKSKNASQTYVWDSNNILRGADLTDANETKNISDGSRFVIPPNTRTATRTTTIGVSGAPEVGEEIWIDCLDVSANTKIVANGGPSGGTILTIPGGTKVAYGLAFDGSDWQKSAKVRLA